MEIDFFGYLKIGKIKKEKFFMIIESLANPLIKQIKKLKEKKNRKETGRYLIEGVNLCLEFLEHTPEDVEMVISTLENVPLVPENIKVTVVSEKVFSSISETKTPQGIMAVGRISEKILSFDDMKLIVYLDDVADPGNVGTIIRTADAFGADAVVLSPNSADIYNSKTVRATMGSLFHIPVVYERDYLEILSECKRKDFFIITGSLDAEKQPSEIDFKNKDKRYVVCLGNEAHGVSLKLQEMGVTKIRIPMPGKAESLNVAVAGAVLLYENVRQRGESDA